MRLLLRVLSLSGMVLFSVAARACTVCDSANGHQLRAGLFNGRFVHTFLLVAAPIPMLVAVVLLSHFGLPEFAERAEAGKPSTDALDGVPGSEVLA